MHEPQGMAPPVHIQDVGQGLHERELVLRHFQVSPEFGISGRAFPWRRLGSEVLEDRAVVVAAGSATQGAAHRPLHGVEAVDTAFEDVAVDEYQEGLRHLIQPSVDGLERLPIPMQVADNDEALRGGADFDPGSHTGTRRSTILESPRICSAHSRSP